MKIDKNIPIRPRLVSLYQWGELEVDDSFYVENVSMNSLRNSAYWFAHRNPPFKIVTRKDGKGFRIWRIK